MQHWLETVYREHRDSFFRLAWIILRDSDASEDAVHSAFARLVRLSRSATSSEPKEPRLFVARCVRNAAIDELRGRKGRATKHVNLDEVSDQNAFAGKGLDLVEADELEAALGKLQIEQREVVEMHLRLEFTFREIADVLGQPISTVSSRYQRAIVALRRSMEVTDERV